jgi:hypothetical protein
MGNNNGAVSASLMFLMKSKFQPAQNANDIEYNRVGANNQNNRNANNIKNKKKVHTIKN